MAAQWISAAEGHVQLGGAERHHAEREEEGERLPGASVDRGEHQDRKGQEEGAGDQLEGAGQQPRVIGSAQRGRGSVDAGDDVESGDGEQRYRAVQHAHRSRAVVLVAPGEEEEDRPAEQEAAGVEGAEHQPGEGQEGGAGRLATEQAVDGEGLVAVHQASPEQGCADHRHHGSAAVEVAHEGHADDEEDRSEAQPLEQREGLVARLGVEGRQQAELEQEPGQGSADAGHADEDRQNLAPSCADAGAQAGWISRRGPDQASPTTGSSIQRAPDLRTVHDLESCAGQSSSHLGCWVRVGGERP